jgi:hypothetical protein
MEQYRIIPIVDEELVYLSVLLKPTRGRKQHRDLLAYLPIPPTWFIYKQEPVISEDT